MKLAILGASGRTGRPLVEQALAAGHEVSVLVRDPLKFEGWADRVRLVSGDATDQLRIEELLAGQEAVLSTLGHTKTSTDDVQARATRYLLEAMKKHGVKRLVNLTGAGVRDAKDESSFGQQMMRTLLKTVAGKVLKDAEAQAALLRNSEAEWVNVRAPRLEEGPRTGQYRTGYLKLGPNHKITRADVADFMLKELTDDTYLRQAPMISY